MFADPAPATQCSSLHWFVAMAEESGAPYGLMDGSTVKGQRFGRALRVLGCAVLFASGCCLGGFLERAVHAKPAELFAEEVMGFSQAALPNWPNWMVDSNCYRLNGLLMVHLGDEN